MTLANIRPIAALGALLAAPLATAAEVVETVDGCLAKLDSSLAVEGVQPSDVPGFMEVEVQGGDFLYVSNDCRFLFAGNLYEVRDGDLIGITEARRTAKRQALIDAIPAGDMLAFRPKAESEASVVIFTDTDCGYCRQLHRRMVDYNAFGIEVRYLAYPRAGVGSPTYDRMVSAWCADDPHDALTRLKNDEEIAPRTCDHPVAEQFRIGQQVGLSGTPTIILPDGRIVPGYVTPEQLADLLGLL